MFPLGGNSPCRNSRNIERTFDGFGFTGTQLTLTGTLNAADLSFIHDGKGRMENVEELDISQIKVMPSDESYANGSVSYVAGDNFLPKAYFYYSTECYCDTTRTTDMLGRGHVTYKIHDNNLAGLFLDNASYKKVILPSWLKTIGKYMFQDSNIENCVFPEVYKEIEDGAFINSKISAQVRKSVDGPPGMLTEDHHHTVHEERQVCYSSHLRPKPLHL